MTTKKNPLIDNNDSNNRYNFDPTVWGPKAWFFLDTIVLSYPDNPTDSQKEDFANFFYLISSVLPCLKCRIHYQENLKFNKLTDDILKNRDNLLDWWLKMHNLIRMTSNKEIISKTDMINYYNKKYNERKKCNRNMVRNMIYVCIFLLLILWFKDIIFNRNRNNIF